MASESWFNRWKLGLAASLALNAILFILWLSALNAASEPVEVAVVVTATPEAGSLPSPTRPLLRATSTNNPTAATTRADATVTPSPTAMLTPIASATATATATEIPTETPPPTATELAALPTPAWLGYVNRLREEGGLPPLSEDLAWSLGSEEHSRYTVKTDFISHSQVADNPWYSQAGLDAARNGNLAATHWFEAPEAWAIDYWISAPFHAIPILDPQLQTVGFGWYREQDGGVVFAANMDILRGLDQEFVDTTYPITFPRDGGKVWVRQSVVYEYPDPLTACPGFAKPTGPPIILQIGAGRGSPVIGGSSFRTGDRVLDHCTFGETTYVNPDPAAQQSGRRILDVRDAIVLIPRLPLQPDTVYTASIIVNGQQHTWSFTAVAGP